MPLPILLFTPTPVGAAFAAGFVAGAFLYKKCYKKT